MIELDCISCGRTLKDATHHMDSARDEGHRAQPYASNPDFMKAPAINVPKRRAVVATPGFRHWDER